MAFLTDYSTEERPIDLLVVLCGMDITGMRRKEILYTLSRIKQWVQGQNRESTCAFTTIPINPIGGLHRNVKHDFEEMLILNREIITLNGDKKPPMFHTWGIKRSPEGLEMVHKNWRKIDKDSPEKLEFSKRKMFQQGKACVSYFNSIRSSTETFPYG